MTEKGRFLGWQVVQIDEKGKEKPVSGKFQTQGGAADYKDLMVKTMKGRFAVKQLIQGAK